MFILPAFNQTIQRLAGSGLGHNTRHVYVGDGIGDVVRPLISAGAKAAARLATKGLTAWLLLATSVLNSFKLQSPWPCARLQRSPRQVRTFCGRGLKTCLYQGYARQRMERPNSPRDYTAEGSRPACTKGTHGNAWSARTAPRDYTAEGSRPACTKGTHGNAWTAQTASRDYTAKGTRVVVRACR